MPAIPVCNDTIDICSILRIQQGSKNVTVLNQRSVKCRSWSSGSLCWRYLIKCTLKKTQLYYFIYFRNKCNYPQSVCIIYRCELFQFCQIDKTPVYMFWAFPPVKPSPSLTLLFLKTLNNINQVPQLMFFNYFKKYDLFHSDI